MRKTLKSIITTLLILSAVQSFSQTAVNFTCNDCAGANHDLFTEHNAGKVIVICWVMPCASCKGPTLTTYNVVKSFEAAYPDRVKLYIVDDYANTTCAALNSWCNSNGFTDALRFSDASIRMTDYGSAGMPKIVVTGNTTHHVYYNANTSVNIVSLQTAISSAINDFAVSAGQPEDSDKPIFPNPADRKATIDVSSFGNVLPSVTLYDVQGKLVDAAIATVGHVCEISTEGIPDGMYMVIIENNAKRKTYRLIVSHQNNQ